MFVHTEHPHSQQGPSYPTSGPHAEASFIASGALGPRRGLAGPSLGFHELPFGGEIHSAALASFVPCSLFSLKFSPPCRWSPPPPQPQKGAEAWGVIRNPDCAKLLCGRPSCNAAPHCLRWLDGESFLWSRWLLGVRMKDPKPSRERQGLHSSGTLSPFNRSNTGAKNGQRGRHREPWEPVRLQGETRKEKALYFPSILPGTERKLPKPRLQSLIGKHKESGLS